MLKNENKVGGFALPDFKTCYKTRVIKTIWHWGQDRYVTEWNRM